MGAVEGLVMALQFVVGVTFCDRLRANWPSALVVSAGWWPSFWALAAAFMRY